MEHNNITINKIKPQEKQSISFICLHQQKISNPFLFFYLLRRHHD